MTQVKLILLQPPACDLSLADRCSLDCYSNSGVSQNIAYKEILSSSHFQVHRSCFFASDRIDRKAADTFLVHVHVVHHRVAKYYVP